MHYYDYIIKSAMDSARYAVTTNNSRLLLFWGSIILAITVVLIVSLIVNTASSDSKESVNDASHKLKFKDYAITTGLILMFFGSFLAIGNGLPLNTGKVEHQQYGNKLLVLQRYIIGANHERDIVKTFKLEHPKDRVTDTKLTSMKVYDRHMVLNKDDLK